MNDFFISISENQDKSYIPKVKAFLGKLYTDIKIDVYTRENISIVYTGKNSNNDIILLNDNNNDVIIVLSGDIELPPDLLNESDLDLKSDLRSHVVSLFQKYGHHVFSKFSGNFNCLSYDFNNKCLYSTNSKLALFPLYYLHSDTSVLFATRLGILKDILNPLQLNEGVLMQQCLYNYPYTGQTSIAGVRLQPSASMLSLSDKELKIKKYWKVGTDRINSTTGYNFKQNVDRIDEVLNLIVKNISTNIDKIGISLTGGWDGRLLLAYALKYLSPEQILLYSHGTKDALDVTVPMKNAKNLGFNYIPVYLDNPEYLKNQLDWAFDTVISSDGYRQIKRCHYLYNMHILKNEFGISDIMTGIGGSNLLKSSNLRNPCEVFNKYVLEMIETDNPESTIIKHYNHIQQNYPGLFQSVSLDQFTDSFDENDLMNLSGIRDKSDRFLHFLISEVERKYFGAEINTYRHLVRSISPFFQDEFLRILQNTVFIRNKRNNGILKSYYNSRLYAQLISRHNPELAKENTDRGFSMYDVSNPYLFPIMLCKYFRIRLKKKNNTDFYRTGNMTKRFIDKYSPEIKRELSAYNVEDNFISNYVTIKSFFT